MSQVAGCRQGIELPHFEDRRAIHVRGSLSVVVVHRRLSVNRSSVSTTIPNTVQGSLRFASVNRSTRHPIDVALLHFSAVSGEARASKKKMGQDSFLRIDVDESVGER